MSHPTSKDTERVRRGASPQSSFDCASPLESAVGEFLEGGRKAPRQASPLDIGGINVDQLALALAERLKEPEPERPMLGELAGEWFDAVKGKRVVPAREAVLMGHLRPLFLDDEQSLTTDAVRLLLDGMVRDGYAPSTVNKVRSAGKLIVEHAMGRKRWHEPNPFALVKRRREPRPEPELLTLEDLARVQRFLSPSRRREFRVQLHLGLRTGELFALRREDVDLEAGTIHIHRSHARNTTKTGRERLVPLPPAIAGDLMAAKTEAKGDLLFANASGSLQRMDTKLTRVLRTAMARAGVGVLSVTYKCRRRGCEAAPEEHPQATEIQKFDCMRCGMRLWPVPRVKRTRWYDLRHIASTLHREHGADRVAVALALGHALEGITEEMYTHPSMPWMRGQLLRWSLP